MSLNIMKRTAPLSLLYCGLQNGGRSRFPGTGQNFTQKREEELDGTEAESLDLEKETQELLRQFYRLHTGLSDVSSWNNNTHRAVTSLQTVVEKLLSNHRIAYRGMVQRLFEQANGLDSVSSVLSGVFSDGVISWGRIATVLALGAMVCEWLKQECVKEKAEKQMDIVASKISSFISTELHHWFISNNGWDGFMEFFRVEDPESTVWNALVAMAGVGLGACLFTLMR